MMARTAGRSVALVAMMVAVVGCGGSGSTTPGADASTGTTPTEAPQPSDATVPSAPVAGGGGGGGGVCDLVTADELAAIFGVDSVTTTVFPGPPDTCAAAAPDGSSLAGWVYLPENAGLLFDSIALPGQSTDVPGIGDKAAFIANTGLVVVKGDSMVTIGVTVGNSDDERNEFAKQIGAKAAGRM